MAVFPDRIILKNSTDTDAAIRAAIGVGGGDEIAQGEIVLGIETDGFRLYTKADDGSIITLDASQAPFEIIISDTEPTATGEGDALTEGLLWWQPVTKNLYIYYSSAWVEISSGSGGGEGGGRGDGGDFDTGTVETSFVVGVYGGGDFSLGSDDIPAELLGLGDGPDAGFFQSAA